MRNFSILLLAATPIFLAGCGGTPAEEPVEQIIVREPGGAEKQQTGNSGLASNGEAAFAACVACHSVEANPPAGPGPGLLGVVGRKAGSVDGFGFTDAMKTSGITWTEAELDSFLTNPSAKIPGTTMAAGAVADPETRKAIIAYLTSISR